MKKKIVLAEISVDVFVQVDNKKYYPYNCDNPHLTS